MAEAKYRIEILVNEDAYFNFVDLYNAVRRERPKQVKTRADFIALLPQLCATRRRSAAVESIT